MAISRGEKVGAWVNLLQVNQVVDRAVEQRLKESEDLSLAEFEVLARLSAASGRRLKMVDIANLLLASKSGVTRIVDRLEKAGLVEREIPRENRRIVYTQLSPTGVETFCRARSVFNEAIEDSFSQFLSDDEVASLRGVLRKLLVGSGMWEDERCSLKLDAPPELMMAEASASS
jgi:DNA-binding MarR family transcriptional regulator